jgi:hypothetical protein
VAVVLVLLGGSAEDTVEKYLFFQCFKVSVGSAAGNFDTMVLVVERGDSTGTLVFL